MSFVRLKVVTNICVQLLDEILQYSGRKLEEAEYVKWFLSLIVC